MAIPIAIPRLGWNMEEGTFGGWLKSEGEPVQAGDRIFVLENEKGTEEIETLDGGFLRIRSGGPKVGDVIAVGTVIGYLVEDMNAELPDVVATPQAAESALASPSIARQVEVRSESKASSPRARRVATELGVDVSTVGGTGRDGRVRERDVRAAIEKGLAFEPTAQTIAAPNASRRTIAARMLESQRLTAPVTLTTTVDATNLVQLRERFKVSGGIVPSYTDIIVKICATAIQQHPMLGAQWTDDGIRLPTAIDIGIAVDSDDGLRVPVIRNVAKVDISEIAKQSRNLIDRARAGKLALTEMQGGCFTVSNLGAYDIDAFTPIINYPECAILGVGRIAKRPAVFDDKIVPRDQVTLSLTFDHRIVDGAPAARFLQTIATLIEKDQP